MERQAHELDATARAERAEEELRAALAERNRLWAELQERRAQEREIEFLRTRISDIERSLAWRITAPLRLAKRAADDPVAAARALLRRYRDWRGR